MKITSARYARHLSDAYDAGCSWLVWTSKTMPVVSKRNYWRYLVDRRSR